MYQLKSNQSKILHVVDMIQLTATQTFWFD